MNTGLFATQYQGWKHRLDGDRTWTDFEEYWQADYDLWHKTSNMAAQVGYGGNINATETIKTQNRHTSTVSNTLEKRTATMPPHSGHSPPQTHKWQTAYTDKLPS